MSFLYGFLFIASYWNPLAKIGEAPIALCSLDQKKLVIQDYNGEKNDGTPAAIIGIPEQFGIPDQYGDVSN
ncbi:hypothetical protein FACS1894218_2330 [Bacilli bacterium]|nr:hypothetical protein FACS1894218_2330 [Bacilli bacterium]